MTTMVNYTDYALQKLKEGGLKITKPRELIVKLLVSTNKALSPYEMKDILEKQNIKADVVTIYRIMEVLEGLGLVHKVLALNAYIRCNIEDVNKEHKPCHHYLLCRKCHKFEEFEGEDLENLEKTISSYYDKFQIESHYLEFVGLCKSCQKTEN